MKKKYAQEYEFSIKDLFNIIGRFKWLIIFILFLSLISSKLYLYFKPSIYSSYSIIEVKTRDKSIRATDDLLQRAFYGTNKAIEKEMEILRTYEINKDVISKLNFRTQVFVKNDYKKDELYGDDIPIEISKVNIIDNKIVGRYIRINLKKDGYNIDLLNSPKEIFLSKIFGKDKLLHFNKKDILYPYNKIIKNNYFTLSLKKIRDDNRTLYFKLNGDIRNIYETIIKNRLKIIQLNSEAPLIKISYEDTIPSRAKNYVNNLVKVFLNSGKISKHKKSNNILKFLDGQVKKTEKKLLSSEKELEEYKVNNNIINPSIQSSSLIEKLRDIEFSISENIFKKRLLDSTIKAINNNKFDFKSIERYISRLDYTKISMEINSLHKLELEETSLASEFTSEYPKLINIRKQISIIRGNIVSDIKGLGDSVSYKILDLKKLKLKYENNLLNLPKKEITLTNLMRKHDVNSKMYAYLLKKKSEKEIIKVATISDYKIIEKGYLSEEPIKPKRSLIVLLSLILGLLIGVFLAIILNRTNKIIRSVNDIENITKLPIYGIIPYLKRNKRNKIDVFNNPESIFSNSYRELRTNLKFLFKNSSSNVILITSLLMQKEKNSVLANLSAIFQLSGYKTIVIDLDLKQKSLNKYFDIDYDIGVSGYLSEKYNLSDIIFPTLYPHLDIIPVGETPLNPSELILSDRVNIMIEKLKERYDYVLINTSPIGVSTDMLNLIDYVDISMIVFGINRAKKIYLERLEKLVEKYDLKNIGLVIDGVNVKNKKDNYI